MTVTDPDVPDPLHDPRTLQADPGALGEGADLASAADDEVATGADELEPASALDDADEVAGGSLLGGASAEAPSADRT